MCYFSESDAQSIMRIYCVALSVQLLLCLLLLFSFVAVGQINHSQTGKKSEIHK